MFRRKAKVEAAAAPDPFASVDPATVPPRFRAAVADAVAARRRWLDLVGGLREGPTRDRLVQLGERVDAGVLAVWETVQRAAEVERIAGSLEVERVTDDYKRAQRDPAAAPELVAALKQRFESVNRVLNSLDDVDERLRLLDARLGAAVARGAEVALAAGAGGEALDAELTAVVDELGALRASLSTL